MTSIKEYIPEIPVHKIDTLDEALALSNFVYSVVPHSQNVEIHYKYSDIRGIYNDFREKRKFGWCYANAMFLHLIYREFGRPSLIYDYGLASEKITHAVVLIRIRDVDYLIDPYFNRHYVNQSGDPYTYKSLIDAIKNGGIPNIRSKYGTSLKDVYLNGSFKKIDGKSFESSVLEGWRAIVNYDNVMTKRFGTLNSIVLLPLRNSSARILNNSDGNGYYEVYK